jgi:hypothetical protein
MVEQATAASASLEEQAEALTRAVGSFKLADAAQAVPAQQRASRQGALPRREPKPPVAELPRKREERKPGKANEDWEEF